MYRLIHFHLADNMQHPVGGDDVGPGDLALAHPELGPRLGDHQVPAPQGHQPGLPTGQVNPPPREAGD